MVLQDLKSLHGLHGVHQVCTGLPPDDGQRPTLQAGLQPIRQGGRCEGMETEQRARRLGVWRDRDLAPGGLHIFGATAMKNKVTAVDQTCHIKHPSLLVTPEQRVLTLRCTSSSPLTQQQDHKRTIASRLPPSECFLSLATRLLWHPEPHPFPLH